MKLLHLILPFTLLYLNLQAQEAIRFGNGHYVDMSVGEIYNFQGNEIRLLGIEGNNTQIEVNGKTAELKIAKRILPEVFDSVRIFIADQKNVKALTTDRQVHALLKKDALLCFSDPSQPLLDTSTYLFPISRKDGYEWSMEEDSYMFSYLGLSPWLGDAYYRSHEGIDLNMHEARGKELHPLVAIEDGKVVLVADSTTTGTRDGCIIVQSEVNEDIYYVYKHTYPVTHKVREEQVVTKGQILSFIWGDGAWGHLHFSVTHRDQAPGYEDRYVNVLNTFPQLYELYHGDLAHAPVVFNEGFFEFGSQRWINGNARRLNEYNPLLGYGWDIAPWNISQKVEGAFGKVKGNARLRKEMDAGTRAHSVNPTNQFEFLVDVENGVYDVSCTIGDFELACEMLLFIEDNHQGRYTTEPASFKQIHDQRVSVMDGNLSVRIDLPDAGSIGGLKSLTFSRLEE